MADFRSPFNSVFQSLSQGHEKAFKQAIYTTAANIFVLLAGASAVAVYFILEAFLRPLLWSVLCGTFLYPFKRELTDVLKKWLRGLQDTGTPFAIGIAYVPIQALDYTYETIYDKVTQHWKLVCGGFLGLFSVYILWYFGPVKSILDTIWNVFSLVYEILDYFTSFWVWTILVAYIIAVMGFWNRESKKYFRLLSVPVWGVLILHIATVAGSLRVPLFILIIGLISTGFWSEIKETKQKIESRGKTVSPSAAAWIVFTGDLESSLRKGRSEQQSDDMTEPQMENSATERFHQTNDDVGNKSNLKKPTDLPIKKPPSSVTSTPRKREQQKISPLVTQQMPNQSLSNKCFIYLFWALVLTRVWMNIWLLQLFIPVVLVMWIFKTLGYQLRGDGILGERVKIVKATLTEWLSSRRDVLAPRWVIGLVKLLSRGDAKMMSMLEQSLDKVTSILFILIMLIGSTLFAVFFAVQVHQESMHLVRISSNVLNNTREFSEWFPKGEDMQVAMDSMVGNAYLYGRKWIATKVQDLVAGQSDVNNTHIEAKVLEVWDNLYQSWLARGAPSNSVAKPGFQIIPSDMLDYHSIYEFLSQGSSFNYSQVIEFVKDNIGTCMSVLENVWLVLKGNMSLLLSIATATLSLILGGGTAILNFVISAAIFLTTLFYLLTSSGKQFKPLEWISGLNPTQSGSKFSLAVEEAIGGVFMASLKMAAFYGLYTWLTHTLFGINMVFIPSALAAVLAAVPFLGPYWATLPAVLELWLIQGQGLMGLCLFICHILPSYIVDTAILSEIKGGHPYMTGLAIAGGIYWLGLEGAIIGPILLCCLIVAVNVYGTLLQPDGTLFTPGVVGDSKARSMGSLSRYNRI